MIRRWPVTLTEGSVGLRPLRHSDVEVWREVRRRNEAWLRPWDATAPSTDTRPLPSFAQMVRLLRAEARAGRCLPFAMTYNGAFVGQLTVGGIQRGSAQCATIGYWIDQRYAGRGITPLAVAMAVDHCVLTRGLHRVEIAIRPENRPSLRVVEKLGLPFEGLRRSFLHIDGDWRDHHIFVALADEIGPRGLVARWLESQQSRESRHTHQ